MNLLYVDCFDLINETETKTEGALVASFEKAVECAPCLLHLANIEALARKSQAVETGQGGPLPSIASQVLS